MRVKGIVATLLAGAVASACTPADRQRTDSAGGTVGASVDSAARRDSMGMGGMGTMGATTMDSATTRALLQSGEWKVSEINMAAATDTNRATLLFGADGKLSGNTTCNTFSGTYTLTGNQITTSQVVATKRACADPKLTDQETKFMRVVQGANSWSIAPDSTLTLTAADGGTIRAKK
jgi:heat shock protein HslJ